MRRMIGGVGALLAFLACATPPSHGSAPTVVGAPLTDTTVVTTAGATAPAMLDTVAWVDSTLRALTLRQRVGQMVTFWMLGDYTSASDSTFRENVRWVEEEGAGGIVMSLGTPVEVAAKLNYLQRRARVPLLVSSDLEPALLRLEGGVFPHYLLETGGATAWPTAMAIAATGREEDAFDVARAIAEEARAVGIHVNYAPTVDVNVNPNNPVIGTRSFGEDPARVARLSAQFVRGTHAGGAMATAKHFPGHGDTDVDSHVGLPVVTADADRLRRVELVPFRAAIDAGADFVMSAHIALPALGGDSATPATLRPDVMTGLLRDTLGFRGVAVTDALSMEGVGKGYSIEESVVRSIQAGTDILLRPGDDVTRAINAVVAAVDRGELTADRIEASVRRILWTKARAGLATERLVSLDSLRNVVGNAAHRRLAQEVAQRAITLVRDTAGSVPVASGARVAIVQYMPETELRAGKAFARELTALRPGSRIAGRITPATGPGQLARIDSAIAGADAVVLAAYVRRVEGEGRMSIPEHVAAWMDAVSARPGVTVIAFGNPYLIRQVPRAGAYLNAYGVSDPLEVAAARALAGTAPITGQSPVSLPGYFTLGSGLRR